MYLSHWNLREQPFQNVADARFAYLSDQHQEGLARLVYVVKTRKLGAALIGTFGVGKSMILELLARNDATLASTRFIQFDAPPDGVLSLARQVFGALETGKPFENVGVALDVIREMTANPKFGFPHTTLAIDEAQTIHDVESIQFLQRLTNFRLMNGAGQPDSPAFTLVLAGHAQLEILVSREGAFRQRLATIWHLEPLDERQTIEYVEFRMRAAGGDIWVFDEGTLAQVAEASAGIPRMINNICDVALMMGYAVKATRITNKIMLQAIEEVCPPAAGGATIVAEGNTAV